MTLNSFGCSTSGSQTLHMMSGQAVWVVGVFRANCLQVLVDGIEEREQVIGYEKATNARGSLQENSSTQAARAKPD